MTLHRRRFLVTASGLLLMPGVAAWATPMQVAGLITELIGTAKLQTGLVKLDIPLLVENGNAVAMTVSVDAPMHGATRTESIHVFAEANPLPNVAHFYFGPGAGRARVSTRIRLATSQTVIAVAKLADGSCWTDSVELLVTLAACLE